MQLSVLIPAIPERWDMAKGLFTRVTKMAEGKDIEVLLFMDNRKRGCGDKQEALKNIANGKYFMFCHDDDDILRLDEVYQETFKDVDVITFKQLCDSPNPQKTPYVVTFGLGNPIEHNAGPVPGSYADCRRPPWIVCAWNQKFKSIAFNTMWGEDGDWVERALPLVKTESFIDVIVCKYNFDAYITTDSRNRIEKPTELPRHVKSLLPFLRR